jgi:hypothetical protein
MANRIVPFYTVVTDFDQTGEDALVSLLVGQTVGAKVIFNTTIGRTRIWNGSIFITAPMLNPDGGTWNVNPKVFIPFYSGTLTLTNMTLADAELPATQYRIKLDLLGFTQFRVTFRVATAGATNSDLRFQYSLNDSAFTNLDGSNGPEIAIGTTGQKDTGWVSLYTAARVNDVYLRMMGKDGDGALDPIVRQIIINFK